MLCSRQGCQLPRERNTRIAARGKATKLCRDCTMDQEQVGTSMTGYKVVVHYL